MQPASKLKSWSAAVPDAVVEEPPSKVQAMEMPEGLSDDEYEVVPKKPRSKSPPKVVAAQPVPPPMAVPQTAEEPVAAEVPVPAAPAINPDATDDDWLRSRTNRLLDLMDPEDMPIETTTANTASVAPNTTTDSAPEGDAEPTAMEGDGEGSGEDTAAQPGVKDDTDAVIEKIKSNGRLFVRNLPYSATEDDLREHFKPYGSLEEVSN